MRKYIFRDSIESLKVARQNPAHRIYIIKVKDANAKGSANVLKDFDRVRRRLVLYELALIKAVFIMLRLCVSNWNLTFMLPSSLDDFRSQSIDSASTCIIALQSVTVRDARQFANADSATAFSREAIFLVLAVHHFVGEAAL